VKYLTLVALMMLSACGSESNGGDGGGTAYLNQVGRGQNHAGGRTWNPDTTYLVVLGVVAVAYMVMRVVQWRASNNHERVSIECDVCSAYPETLIRDGRMRILECWERVPSGCDNPRPLVKLGLNSLYGKVWYRASDSAH
jgi:hypothetical protein